MGGDVREFNVCDRVACARGGSALSVEIIRIPTNLCTKVLEDFKIEEVSFSTLGEKALQSVRQANVRILKLKKLAFLHLEKKLYRV